MSALHHFDCTNKTPYFCVCIAFTSRKTHWGAVLEWVISQISAWMGCFWHNGTRREIACEADQWLSLVNQKWPPQLPAFCLSFCHWNCPFGIYPTSANLHWTYRTWLQRHKFKWYEFCISCSLDFSGNPCWHKAERATLILSCLVDWASWAGNHLIPMVGRKTPLLPIC